MLPEVAAVLEQMPDAVLVVDEQGRCQWANGATERLLRLGAGQAVGRLVVEGGLLAADAEGRARLEALLAGPVPASTELAHAPSGRWFAVHASAHAAGHGAGRLLQLRDVSARRHAEEALRESERTLATLLGNLPGMVYRCRPDAAWTMEFVSEGSLDVTGFPPAALVGSAVVAFSDLIHPEDRQRVHDEAFAALERREPFELHYRLIAADGGERRVRERGRGVLDANGAVTALEGFIEDVTEHEQATRALRSSGERLRLALASARMGTWDWAVGSDRLSWSPVMEQINGFAPGTFPGTAAAVKATIHPDDLAHVSEVTLEALRHGADLKIEYRAQGPDGRLRRLELRGRLLEETTDEPARMMGICVDVTERHRLEEQLRQSQKLEALGRLAGGIAHDFNNLLTAILSNAEFALAALPDDVPARADVQEIRSATRRAADLVRQLLAFSRQQVLQPCLLDLNEVVSDAERMLRRLVHGNVTVLTSLSAEPGLVRADRSQLEQVLVNLVVNARDAMPAGGALFLQTAPVQVDAERAVRHDGLQPGSYVQLTVRDTGGGMDAATLAQVFDPFFTTKAGMGTGLGLATVYGIVRQSGGAIEVESTPGAGSTFTILLPRVVSEELREPRAAATGDLAAAIGAAEPAVAAAPAAPPTAPSPTPAVVLLTEDEAAVRTATRRMLERSGFRVLEAADGHEALQLWDVHGTDVSLLVTDMVMPGMDGQALADRLRGARPDLPVLYMSGFTETPLSSLDATDSGPRARFLAKPFELSELVSRVWELVG